MRKTRVEVVRAVIWRWRVVCGVRGRGRESCLGLSVGETVSGEVDEGSGGGG